MRSQSFLRKSQLAFKHSPGLAQPIQSSVQCSSVRALRYKQLRPTENRFQTTRALSSISSPSVEPEDGAIIPEQPTHTNENSPPEVATHPEEQERITKIRRTRISSTKEGDVLEFPEGLESDVLYVQSESVLGTHSGLPPPEIFEEALDNLMIAFHPQNQHRAIHATGGSTRPVEPTLGLYCPIEGGDYVIDLTVQELSYQTGAEVLVLDSVQLAAGEWGIFGKAASALQLPNNPLHFSAPSIQPPAPERPSRAIERDEDDSDEGSSFMFPARMSLTFPKILSSVSGRSVLGSPRKVSSPTKLDSFFETLVNMPLSVEEKAEDATSRNTKSKPRIIYLRDFPTLAPSSAIWYPALLAAVRQRRRRLLSRSSNTTASPVAIVFGMTPSIVSPSTSGSAGSSNGNLMNLLLNRNSSSSQLSMGNRGDHTHDWSESEVAETAREKRLRTRLKKWERNAGSLHDEFPTLSTAQEAEGSSKPNIVVIGDGSDAPITLPSLGFDSMDSASESNSQFFRSSILVPSTRSIGDERETRVARRREINELIMRMGVGSVGGRIEGSAASSISVISDSTSTPVVSDEPATPPSSHTVWIEWGDKIEAWSNVRKIADRAIGSVMASQQTSDGLDKVTLAPTVVSWSAVEKAWNSYHSLSDVRKNWLKETITSLPSADESTEGKEKLLNAGSGADKLVESIKNDPDLDQHEARLLPCIVDSQSITTTFKQVHLPSHTIDSIRTIVSLPLLYPQAFQQGILKEHSMTGCLLFGPPGTGKTLAVRALAKEAGCRMLAVSPSDVMDMYVGEGEKLVRAVFALARKLSPCVVFLDEIDALFGARMSARESGSAFAHRGVITEFMQEMDGLKSSKDDNVIVIGATNRPFDLDDAVLRRLPRRLMVDLPGENERKEILKILLRDEILAPDMNLDSLAKKTEAFSGSDLKHLCVSAALDAVKERMQLPWLSRHHILDITPPTSSTPSLVEVAQTTKETVASTGEETAEIAESLSTITSEKLVDLATPVATEQATKKTQPPRILYLHNFTQALKEITPSSSETLGSLSELRKWNEEFGEGRKDRKKRQVWGKGLFGFIEASKEPLVDSKPPIANE